jgi:acyl-CoA synthetase (AMP-forming)/AMP-acid ligase II
MLRRIVGVLREGAPPPSTLQTLAYGGAPASASLIGEALHLFPQTTGFVNAYGLTETSSTIALLGPDDHRRALSDSDAEVRARLASVGRPVPGVEVRIAGELHGEILIRGPQVSGEYGREGVRLDREGWFHTGDVGYLDSAGYLFVTGRDDDMIIRGGENISPTEIEDVLAAHPMVVEAAVVGVPDDEWGQCVEAAVAVSGEVSGEDLISWARSRLPSFKVPRQILVTDALPRNDLGKLQRFKVREMLTSGSP